MTKYTGYAKYNQVQAELNNSRSNKSGKLSYRDSSKHIVEQKQYDNTTGVTVSSDMRLAILQPTSSYLPSKEDVQILKNLTSPSLLGSILNKFSGIVAVDIETHGTQAANPDCIIVGIGMADASQIIYVDLTTCTKTVRERLYTWLKEYTGTPRS